MKKDLLKRFLLMFPSLRGVAVLIFVLIRIVPGDVVELRLAGDSSSVSEKVLAEERAKHGLDKPVWQQFATWVWGAMRLDFGKSMWTGAPISEEIKLRFALSLQLAVMATVVAVVIAIPLGVISALKQDTWIDYTVRIASIAGLATPSFWLGIVFILCLLIFFKWLPPMVYTPFWVNPWQNMLQLIWPGPAVGQRDSAADPPPRGAGQGAGREADPLAPRLEERAAAGGHGDLPGVRLPARRARGDRAG